MAEIGTERPRLAQSRSRQRHISLKIDLALRSVGKYSARRWDEITEQLIEKGVMANYRERLGI